MAFVMLMISLHGMSASVSGSGSTLTITLDASEELTIKSNGPTNNYTFSLLEGGTWTGSGFETMISSNVLTVNSSALSTYSLFRIEDGGSGTTVKFDEGASLYGDNFEIILDAGAALVTFWGTTEFTGSFGVTVTTDGPIRVDNAGGNPVLKTVNGNITLSANMQTPSSAFDAPGVYLTSATIESTGSGVVTVKGTSGEGTDNHGINFWDNSSIIGGTTGTTVVEGYGGLSKGGNNNGILMGGTINSNGSDVYVKGVGGGTGTSNSNVGINFGSGQITAGGSGSVSVVGTGGIGYLSYGVQIGSSGVITSSGGNVSVTGTGGSGSTGSGSFGNTGVLVVDGGQITSGPSGTVTVEGTGGAVPRNDNYGIYVRSSLSSITSGGGNLTVTGTGGGSGTSASNHGVYVHLTGRILAAGSGTVTVSGTGGSSTGANSYGLLISGASSSIFTGITSEGGDVTVTGTGGSSSSSGSHGVYVTASSSSISSITSGSGGSVTVTGTGRGGTGNSSHGVFVEGSTTSSISSGGGNVIVTGTGGGSGASASNYGVHLATSARITAGGSATVTVTGTTSASSGGSCHGVYILSGSSIRSNATTGGAVSVTGTGGASTGNSNHGVFVTGGSSSITSGSGLVTVTGTAGGSNAGGSTSATNHGVFVSSGGSISAGSTSNVNVTGTGGTTPGNSSHGVYVDGNNSNISSAGGSITVTGAGGGTSTSTTNHGVLVENQGKISGGGTGTVSVTGTGGSSTGINSYGVYVNGSSSGTTEIASAGGVVTVNGTGGNSSSAGSHGVYVKSGGSFNISRIVSGTDASLTVTGLARGGSGNSHHGVFVDGASATLSSGGGNVSVTGTAGGTGASASNYGVYLAALGRITAGGSGTVAVNGTGTATTGSACHGVYLNTGGVITSNSGAVTVTGTAGASSGNTNHGVFVTASSSTITSGGGNVSVTGNGGGTSTSATNHGVYVSSTGVISAGTGGSVSVIGTGGTSTGNTSHGVIVEGTSSTVTSNGGNVSVTGTAGGSGASITNYGVYVTVGTITATGTGTVTVVGNGGNTGGVGATAANNHGVYLASAGKITSSDGNVTVTGTGGGRSGSEASAANQNVGVYLASGSYISAGGSGSTSVTGQGGANNTLGTGASNHGVWVNGASSYISAANGSVTVTGTGGSSSGNDNFGVRVDNTSTTTITSGGGNVSVTGTGGGTGASINNHGVYVSTGIITAGGTGTVTVSGTGGNSTGAGATLSGTVLKNNVGVILLSSGSIRSNDGNVSVAGNGGGVSGSVVSDKGYNHGVSLETGAFITSGGTGSTTITGKGGANSTGTPSSVENYGVYIYGVSTTNANSTSRITSAGGSVTVNGTGGGDGGDGLLNCGIYVSFGGLITSGSTTHTVTVNGTGGASTGSMPYGIRIDGAGNTNRRSIITSGGGHVVINATGGSAGSGSLNGLVLTERSQVTTGGASGILTINATAGQKVNIDGTGLSLASNTNVSINSGGGNVTITATEGMHSTSRAVSLSSSSNGPTIDLTANGGNLTIYANSIRLAIATNTLKVNSTNTLSLIPRTAGTQVSMLSTANDPYQGPLEFTSAKLGYLTAGTLRIGDATTGLNTVSASMTGPSGMDIVLTTSSSSAGVSPTATGADFTMATGRTLTLSAPLNIAINGTTANNESTGYRQLSVTGTTSTVALSGATLSLSGSYTPVSGNEFTIVSAVALTGTFDGLPNGSIVRLNGVPLSVNYSPTAVTLRTLRTLTWDGSSSDDWSTAANWTPESVPTQSDIVTISSSATVMPALSSPVSLYNLNVPSGSNLTVAGGQTLALLGDLNVGGSITGEGTLTMEGSAEQAISGSGTVNNLTINNPNGVTIASGAGNTLSVTGSLSPVDGILTTNGNLRLKSTSTATARVGVRGAGSISGNVTVERFLEGSNRIFQWRIMGFPYSTPVTLSDISGLAIDVNTNRSVMIFHEDLDDAQYGSGGSRNGGYEAFDALSDQIPAYRGFAAWVYGSTGATAGGGQLASPLTISSSGELNESGDFVSIPVTYHAGKGWNLVSNPYASSIDWQTIATTEGALVNVDATIYRWNPIDQTWVTFNGTENTGTGMNSVIESGAGFFVRTHAESPTLTISQSAKVETNANSTNLFRAAPFRLDLPSEAARLQKSYRTGIRMRVSGMGNPAPDEVYLDLSRNDATARFDSKYDAYSMGRTAGAGLAIADSSGLEYAMQFDASIKRPSNERRYYPLTVTTPRAGETRLSILRQGDWDTSNTVSLIDKVENRTLLMTGNSLEYTFRLDKTKVADRFVLAVNHVPPAKERQTHVLVLGNPVRSEEIDMIITHPIAQPKKWVVSTMNGARIGEGGFQAHSGNVQHRIKVPAMRTSGVYLLQVEMENGDSQTVRVMRQ